MKFFFCEDKGPVQNWTPLPDFTTQEYADALGMALPEDKYYVGRITEEGRREWLAMTAGYWAWSEADDSLTYVTADWQRVDVE